MELILCLLDLLSPPLVILSNTEIWAPIECQGIGCHTQGEIKEDVEYEMFNSLEINRAGDQVGLYQWHFTYARGFLNSGIKTKVGDHVLSN